MKTEMQFVTSNSNDNMIMHFYSAIMSHSTVLNFSEVGCDEMWHCTNGAHG